MSQITNLDKVNNRGRVTLSYIADLLFILSIYLFSYRGNIGATVAILSIIVRIANGKLSIAKAESVIKAWALYLLVFAIILYAIRTLNFEFYVFAAYLSAFFVLLFSKQINIELILRGLFIISLFVLAGVFLQFIVPDLYVIIAKFFFTPELYARNIERQTSGYITGFTREVSYSSLFLSIGFLYVLAKKRGHSRTVLLVLFFVAMFITGKKTQPIFIILAIIFVYLLQSEGLRSHLKSILASLFGIGIAIVTFPVWSRFSFMARIVDFINSIINSNNSSIDLISISSGRYIIYTRAIELWQQQKIIGIGWENFRNLGAYGNSEYTTWFRYFDVHNCYLQILCETGIIGAIIFCILFLFTLGKVINKLQKDSSPNVWIASVFILFFWMCALTEPSLYTDSYVILMCFFYIVMFKNKSTRGIINGV